jgi:cytochrome c oxidase subunit IV
MSSTHAHPHADAHAKGHAEPEFGSHGHAHGHTIVPLITLRMILASLMFFTLLTVGLAQLEIFLAHQFNIVLPQILNVFVALSIATIKTTIVVMYFMQLKYDNPINTMVFLFTVLTVAFFLGFTALDLGNRQTVDRFKGQYVVDGGTGLDGSGMPITQKAKSDGKSAKGAHGKDAHDAHGKHVEPFDAIAKGGYMPEQPDVGSSPQRSRPVAGLTLPGLAAPKGDGHDDNSGAAKPADAAHGGK